MRKRIEWSWEKLDDSTCRARVIGGWIIRSRRFIEGKQAVASESMSFVPDRDHEWHIVQPQPVEKEAPFAGWSTPD